MESETYTEYRPSRRTIVLDGHIETKLRELQGQLIANEGKNFSLSKILNVLVLGGIVATKQLDADDWKIIRDFSNGGRINIIHGISLDSYIKNLSKMRMWI